MSSIDALQGLVSEGIVRLPGDLINPTLVAPAPYDSSFPEILPEPGYYPDENVRYYDNGEPGFPGTRHTFATYYLSDLSSASLKHVGGAVLP